VTCQFWTLFCRPSQSWSSANDTNTSTACGHSRRGPEQVSVSPWVRDALMFIHAHVNDNESNLVSSLNLHACVWVFLTAQMYCAWAKLPPNITWQPMFCNNEAYFRVFFVLVRHEIKKLHKSAANCWVIWSKFKTAHHSHLF